MFSKTKATEPFDNIYPSEFSEKGGFPSLDSNFNFSLPTCRLSSHSSEEIAIIASALPLLINSHPYTMAFIPEVLPEAIVEVTPFILCRIENWPGAEFNTLFGNISGLTPLIPSLIILSLIFLIV